MSLYRIHSTKAIVTIIATVLLLCMGQDIQAQPATEKEDRLLIILNGSASMQQPWTKDTNSYHAATEIIWQLATALHEANEQVSTGLRLYGHQYSIDQHTCADTRMEVPPGKDNQARLYLRLQDISPKGEGSLTYALQKSYEQDFTDTGRYRYSLLIVTDTSKSCTGNPCAVLDDIRKTYRPYKLYMVILTSKTGTKEQSCYDRGYTLTNSEQAAKAIEEIVSDFPKAREKEYFEPVTMHRQQPEDNWQTTKKEMPEKQPEATATQMVKSPANDVVIRKQSHITTDTPEYGYINLLYTRLPSTLGLYRLEKGWGARKVTIPGFPGKPSQRVKIPEGNYQLICNGAVPDTVKFFIKKNMITDVQLR